jgi:hypothetical protein
VEVKRTRQPPGPRAGEQRPHFGAETATRPRQTYLLSAAGQEKTGGLQGAGGVIPTPVPADSMARR